MAVNPPPRPPRTRRGRLAVLGPGLLVTAAGVGGSLLLHSWIGAIGLLTWAVLLGALATNSGRLPASARPGLNFTAKKLLRAGVVLLGFSLPITAIVDLGPSVIAMIVVTLLVTLLVTLWFGLRIGLGRPSSLLIATGFAICGASAVAAMADNADADEDDVATAIAMITICGTVAMLVVPLLQAPLGLTTDQLGAWAGASVHEVGQVVAAAGPAGGAAVAVAVVVKLTRVLLLAPVVIGVSLIRRHRDLDTGRTGPRPARPPLVPPFVLGFLACVLVRSLGVVPDGILFVIATIQTILLAAALVGLGAAVHLRELVRTGGRALVLGSVSTAVVAGISLPWVIWLV